MLKIRSKKNIIMFSVDARRKDFYEVFGGKYSSPNMNRMAENGIVFNKMYSPSASTVMTLSAIINGRYCHEFDRFTYPEKVPKFFEDNLFKQLSDSGKKSFILYTDEYLTHYADGIYNGPDAERIRIDNVGACTNYVKEILKVAEKQDDPYLIMLHASVGEPNVNPDNPNLMEEYALEDDRAIGYLLDNVNLDETTIVFYSDHGNMYGEHGHLFQHAFYLYEEISNIPCIVTSDEAIVTDDLYSAIQLKDLLLSNEIRPAEMVFGDTQYRAQPHRITMVIKGEWKYIAHYSPHTAINGKQEELYHLKADPNEHRNLVFDIARHPLRFDWNSGDMKSEAGYVFKYDEEYIELKADEMRAILAEIWLNDLDKILKAQNIPMDELIAQIRKFTPFNQLAAVSELMCREQWPNIWYGGPLPKSGPWPQPPFGYQGLPRSFKDF